MMAVAATSCMRWLQLSSNSFGLCNIYYTACLPPAQQPIYNDTYISSLELESALVCKFNQQIKRM